MNTLAEHYHHRAAIQYDNSDTVLFRWHWPRGTLAKRMSAQELAAFIIPHMPSIVPLFAGHPKVQTEFASLLVRVLTWPAQVLDEVVPWIKSVTRTEEADIIELNLGAKVVVEGPKYFVLGN